MTCHGSATTQLLIEVEELLMVMTSTSLSSGGASEKLCFQTLGSLWTTSLLTFCDREIRLIIGVWH